MTTEQLRVSMRRAMSIEMEVCEFVNRYCHPRRVKNFFVVISWLGDGKAWYVIMLALPLIYGERGLGTSWSMTKIAIVNVIFYKVIKQLTSRRRPCAVSSMIRLGTVPLDQYSFPSGHTMHAVAFTMAATAHHPELSCVLLPFSVLVAVSRVVLGLHYPTDVLAGGLIGGYVASLILAT